MTDKPEKSWRRVDTTSDNTARPLTARDGAMIDDLKAALAYVRDEIAWIKHTIRDDFDPESDDVVRELRRIETLLMQKERLDQRVEELESRILADAKVIEAAKGLAEAADAVTAFVGYSAHVPDLEEDLDTALAAFSATLQDREKETENDH